MKKLILIVSILLSFTFVMDAQKFATVDMEYIMKNIPAFESANMQLNQVSKKWQAEVEDKMKEVQQLYKNYQTELVFMSDEMKVKREDEIIEKEKASQELKRNYFGPEGELFKKRESLIKPIQDEIYEAIKELSESKGLDLVIDKTSAMSAIFISNKIDISDEVLKNLGYSK